MELPSQIVGQGKGRGHFNHFLVTTLDGAVSFPQMHNISGAVTNNLDFDLDAKKTPTHV